MDLNIHKDSLDIDISEWNQKLQEFYRYWQKIGQGKVPLRQDLDPLDIPHLLPNVWMLDAQFVDGYDPCRFQFRLMGTHHVDAMGYDLTGKYLDEIYQGEGVQDYIAVALERKVSYRKGPAAYHVRDDKQIERVMLPMHDDRNNCPIIFAITVYH